MKKLSSDILFFVTLAQVLMATVIIVMIITSFNIPGIGMYIMVLAILPVLGLYSLLKKKRVFYKANALVYYPSYFNSNSVSVPFSQIINISAKSSGQPIFSAKIFTIIYQDKGAQRKMVFFMPSNTTEHELKNLLKEKDESIEKIYDIPQWAMDLNLHIKKQLDAGNRLLAAITDQFIMTAFIMIFSIPEFIRESIYPNIDPRTGVFWHLSLAGFALIFCKDCIQGQSPSKRLFNQQVINNKTNQIANPLRCFVRDIFMIIWPVEAIMILVSPTRRLGDRVAGTKIIPFDENLEKPPLSYLQIGFAYILSFAFLEVLSKIF